jgi:hypothetical protein
VVHLVGIKHDDLAGEAASAGTVWSAGSPPCRMCVPESLAAPEPTSTHRQGGCPVCARERMPDVVP